MMTVQKTKHLAVTGWSAVSVLATITITKALTSHAMSLPIAWLVNRVFAAGAIHATFGTDHFSYWHCVGLFAIRFAARVRIKFTGPAQIRGRSPMEKLYLFGIASSTGTDSKQESQLTNYPIGEACTLAIGSL